MAARPDPQSATRAEIELAMLTHLREAHKASVSYGERDAEIYTDCVRRARTGREARLNARIIAQRDPALGDHARLLAHHQTMHALYAMHLLVTDRPFPPDGRRPAPGSAAAVVEAAASESARRWARPSGAGVSSDPRPRRAKREPNGNGVRPGVGQVPLSRREGQGVSAVENIRRESVWS